VVGVGLMGKWENKLWDDIPHKSASLTGKLPKTSVILSEARAKDPAAIAARLLTP